MATFSVQRPVVAGTLITFSTGSASDDFVNTGKEYLHVKNSHATNVLTVTIDAPGTCNFNLANNAAHDQAITVAAGGNVQKIIGPFPPVQFNSATGKVVITYSTPADASVAVVAGPSI